MKYLFTTRINPFIILALLVLSSNFSFAQKYTDSPYSRYGIGLLNNQSFNGNFGTAGTGIAWRPYQYRPLIYDSLSRSSANINDRGTNYINPKNPASFSNISLTTFETGILSRSVEYTSNGQVRNGNNTQLSHMALAFPVSEKLGFGFGIKPYSSVGYDYQVPGEVNGNSLSYFYAGNGGLNQVFLATALEFKKHFSLGFSANYIFGSVIDSRRIIFNRNSSNFYNTLDQRTIKIGDFNFDLGLQYFKSINKKYRIILGIVASPVDEVRGEQTQIIRSYEGIIGFENFKDTVFSTLKQDINVNIFPKYGVGFAIEKKLDWIINFDYSIQVRDQGSVDPGISFSNNHMISAGIEKYNDISAFGSYIKQVGLRFGGRYNSSLLTVDGTDVKEFGISFGLALPLRKSFSTINFGVELGRRGEDKANLTQEDFFNFQVGVTINDKWFIQRKYD